MQTRKFDEMISYFNRKVSSMDIDRKYKIELLGMIMAIGLAHEKEMPHWIPCSERLPEDWVPVLVTLKKPERLPAWIKAKPENYFHIVDADVCENGEWSVNKKNVIAWIHLPEPYREEGEEHEAD